MSMEATAPTKAQLAFLADLKEALSRHTDLSSMEMLAVASQLIGNLIAFQDQQKVTLGMAMELVSRNIEAGNAAAIQSSLGSPKGRG